MYRIISRQEYTNRNRKMSIKAEKNGAGKCRIKRKILLFSVPFIILHAFYTNPILRRMYSHPVMVNALNNVVSMTTLDVSTPSWPMFRAIT